MTYKKAKLAYKSDTFAKEKTSDSYRNKVHKNSIGINNETLNKKKFDI